MSNEPVIEIKKLQKKYKKLVAVDGLNLTVYKGDLYGFLGPNGAGKSTTIRMLLNLIYSDSGEINIFGLPVNKFRNEILRKTGALIEKPDFYNYLSAYKNLEILARLSGIDDKKQKIMKMLELVGLEKRADSKVRTFSHGMKQRLGLAQTLLHDPELIILDEPGNGLDPQSTKELRDLLIRLNTNEGKTIFLSSHILHEIEMMATRMVIINKGKNIVEGNVKDLLNTEKLNVTFSVNLTDNAIELFKTSGIDAKLETIETDKITLFIAQNDIPRLNKLFVENGIDVKSIVPVRSLENYFLEITVNN